MIRTVFSRARTVLLALLCAGAAVAAVPSSAMAATPESACGSGFARASDGSRAVKTASGTVYGYVYLLWNNSTQENCVVTLKTSFVGTPTSTAAWLIIQEGSGDNWVKDEGNFGYYAVTKAYAPGKCVQYWGGIYSGPNYTGTLAQGGRDTWGNCG